MAIKQIISTNDGLYAAAVSNRPNSNANTLDWALGGKGGPTATGLNDRYCPPKTPFALGTGVLVDSTGRYLMDDSVDHPVSKFTVINADTTNAMYVGINIGASGSWTLADGLAIDAGKSYTFGGGSRDQVIRNVWAMTLAATTAVAQGQAIELEF